MKERIKELKLFDWKLFIALVLLLLVPAVIQTIETFVISSSISVSGIDVIGQIEWFDLVDETIQAFLIIPLYSILNTILKRDETLFGAGVFKTGFIAFVLYALFSVVVLIYSAHLISFMNPDEADISLINSYLSMTTVAFMVGIIVSFVNVVFVVLGKSKNVYIFLAVKAVVTVICDFIIIPRFGVMGVATSNILINAILAVVGILILVSEKAISFTWFKKDDVAVLKEWGRIGVFSGVQQFIANIVYALMIVKMVNMVSESGNYWVANNFIWGWLLIPINALSEVIRKDCKDGYFKLKQSNYYLIITAIVLLWCVTIPLWTPFFKSIERLENYQRIFGIVIMAFPFFIPYAFQQIPDNIFVGLGKTKYNFLNTCVINFVYYGIWYVLYKANVVSFSMNTIIMMFGFGMVSSYLVSISTEKILLRREMAQTEMVE